MFDALRKAFGGQPQDIDSCKGYQTRYLGFVEPTDVDYGLAEWIACERHRLGISGEYRVNKKRNEANQAKYDLKGAAAEIVGVDALLRIVDHADIAEFVALQPEKRPDVILAKSALDIKGACSVVGRLRSERHDKFIAINAIAHRENAGLVDAYLAVYFESETKAHIFLIGYDYVSSCERKEPAFQGANPWYAVDVNTLIKSVR